MKDLIKVIIVDDEDLVGSMLRSYLEDFNIKVKTALSGKDAISIISKEQFNVAIVDMRLPDIVGEDLIFKMREILPGLKFFIHTGSLDYFLSEELIKIGLTESSIFRKPVKNLEFIYKKISGLEVNS